MKENISDNQGTFLLTMFIMGSTLVLGIGSKAKQDIWLAVLLSIVFALPVYLIYSRLLYIFHGKDLFDILPEIFGVFFGKVISMIFIWYAFHLGSVVLRNFSEFMKIVAMPESPAFISAIFMGTICIWAIKDGIELMGRLADLILPILVAIIVMVVLLSLPVMHLDNLRPVLFEGMKPVLNSTFTLFSFPFAEAVIFLMVFSSLKSRGSSYKVYMLALLLSGIVVLIVLVRNVLVLGPEVVPTLYFPSYTSVTLINIGNFLQRMEIMVALIFLSTGFIKISICLYAATNGLTKVLNIDNYRWLVAPIALLMINQSLFIYKDVMEMQKWASDIYKYYALPFQIILPVIIWIIAEIKMRRTKGKKQLRGKC